MIKDSSRPCDGTHFFNEWAAFTTSLNISSESGRTFGDACQLFYCIFAGILDMRKGRKLAWLLGFRLRLTTLVPCGGVEAVTGSEKPRFLDGLTSEAGYCRARGVSWK